VCGSLDAFKARDWNISIVDDHGETRTNLTEIGTQVVFELGYTSLFHVAIIASLARYFN